MDKDEMELRRVGQDLKLFLRLAASNFDQPKDLAVIARLNQLADKYASGINIWLQTYHRENRKLDKPAHKQEGTQAEFDRYIAGTHRRLQCKL